MKNTLEIRLKLYSAYLGSDIIIDSDCFQSEGKNEIIKTKLVSVHLRGSIECDGWIPEITHTYLELKPLSSITDEDAKKLGYRDSDHFKIDANELYWKDELRLLGYAINWVGLTVEELLNFGWIKLKEN